MVRDGSGTVLLSNSPEGLEFVPGEVLIPLASLATLAVDVRDLVEATNHGAGQSIDAQRSGPQISASVVVVTAVAQFQQSAIQPTCPISPVRKGRISAANDVICSPASRHVVTEGFSWS